MFLLVNANANKWLYDILRYSTHNTVTVDSKYHHYPYVGSIFKVPSQVPYFLDKSQRKFMFINDKPVCLK